MSRHGSILQISVEAYFPIPGLQLGAIEEKLAVIVRANHEEIPLRARRPDADGVG